MTWKRMPKWKKSRNLKLCRSMSDHLFYWYIFRIWLHLINKLYWCFFSILFFVCFVFITVTVLYFAYVFFGKVKIRIRPYCELNQSFVYKTVSFWSYSVWFEFLLGHFCFFTNGLFSFVLITSLEINCIFCFVYIRML